MEKRERLISVHILQSIAIAVLAGLVVVFLKRFLSDEFNYLADRLADLGQYGICGLLTFLLACAGIIFPQGFISIIKSLRWLPVHFGVLLKVIMGSIVYLLLMWPYTSALWNQDPYVYFILISHCVLGLLAGWALAFLIKKLRMRGKTGKQGIEAWLDDDQPIRSEDDSKFPEHSFVAKRILNKLLTKSSESKILASVALIGPYGSGKTSICNLVEDIYNKDKKRNNLPKMLFCRFEAWQFLSAEAAVKSLIDVAAREVLKLADLPELWRIPEKYIEAIKASGTWWGKVCTVLFGGNDEPEGIVSIIGNVLMRLNVHLVIFVDDFDRIEEDTFSTQQAVAKALNRLQNLPNTQYVISVGPTFDVKDQSTANKPSRDLLKLTRFQELVPKIDPRKVISFIRKLRDKVLEDSSCYFVWAEGDKKESDPFVWHEPFRHIFFSTGIRKNLIGLVQTPRVLKCVLRESQAAWEGGLKGEINWYDLILANALRAAEPAVFEWIARDRDIFIEKPGSSVTELESEANIKYAKELEQQLIERVESKEPARYETVKEVVCELFHFFEMKLQAKSGRHMSYSPAPQWSQKVSLRPDYGADYIERFFAGGVPEGDIPDQPILQYILRIMKEGFNGNEFESLYLDSEKKLTGPLNKIVQFAGLIPRRLAYDICDKILYWIADPEHAEVWSEPESYLYDMLPDVFTIIDNANSRQKVPIRDNRVADEREEWLIRAVQIYTRKAPLLSTAIVKDAIKKGYKCAEKLPDVLLKHLESEFLKNIRRFLPVLSISRFSLAWLVNDISEYEGYKNIKESFTQKVIAEAENEPKTDLKEKIIFSLVAITTPARRGEIRPEEYNFSVERGKNEQKYAMSFIIDALKRWYTVKWSDEIVKRAFSRIKIEYKID